MDCEEIKSVIPKYFNHTASEDEIKTVEEHLCVCHDCRSTLGELMDKLTIPEEPELTSEPAAPIEPRKDMEYVSEKETLTPPEPEPIKEEPSEKIEPVSAESLTEPEKKETPSEPEPEPDLEPANKSEKEEFPLDDIPLNKSKAGIFEYAILIIGVAIFGALLYLLLKG